MKRSDHEDATQQILTKLDGIAQHVQEIDKKLESLQTALKDVNQRVNTILFCQTMKRMMPKTLERIIPQLENSIFSYDIDASGIGQTVSAKWLRNSLAMTMMSMPGPSSCLPFSKMKELMELAVKLAPLEHRARILGLSFFHYLNRGMYSFHQLYPLCETFEAAQAPWEPRLSLAWAICMAVFGEVGEDTKARKLIEKYDHYYGLTKLAQYAPAAFHARRLGFDNDRTAFAAQLYQDEREETNRKRLENMIKDRTIAIVGGGPYEKGKRKGSEIDGHDLVVRIKYLPSPESITDYGSKTDIVTLNNTGIMFLPLPPDVRMLMFPMSFASNILPDNFFKTMSEARAIRDIPLVSFRMEEMRSLLDMELYTNYSTGVMTIGLFKKFQPKLSFGDLYGFSHTQADSAELGYWHYDMSSLMGDFTDPINSENNMSREREYFQHMFAEEA